MIKEIEFASIPGKCIIPACSQNDPHEFGLYDKDGKKVQTSIFSSMEKAKKSADEEFFGNDYSIKDLTEEWYVNTAMKYRKRIKKLHPSFKITSIVLDMSEMYYSRSPNDWYTFIPFNYKGVRWCYRETASEEWVHKAKEFEESKKETLDERIACVKNSKSEDLEKQKNIQKTMFI